MQDQSSDTLRICDDGPARKLPGSACTEAGAYRIPVRVPKLGFCRLGTGQVQTSAPYRVRKVIPSLKNR